MAERERGSFWKRLRRSIGQIGPVRLLATFLFLAAGLYIARFDIVGLHIGPVNVPLAGAAERALYDLRLYHSAERTLQQDDRIVLITYNDDTLAELQKRSPLDRHLLAQALATIENCEIVLMVLNKADKTDVGTYYGYYADEEPR